jgi:hypothetical protein
MNSESSNDPARDPDRQRGMSWWNAMGKFLVSANEAPSKRWWIHWAIGILIFGSLVAGAVLCVHFFGSPQIHGPAPNP